MILKINKNFEKLIEIDKKNSEYDEKIILFVICPRPPKHDKSL